MTKRAPRSATLPALCMCILADYAAAAPTFTQGGDGTFRNINATGGTLPGVDVTSAVVQLNGSSATLSSVALQAASAVPLSLAGQPNGWLRLDANGLVPPSALPTSIPGVDQTARTSASAALVAATAALPLSALGQPRGAAPLDTDGLVPVSFLPASVTSPVDATARVAAAQALAAANMALPVSAVGQPNGAAPLDTSGLVPVAVLPPSVTSPADATARSAAAQAQAIANAAIPTASLNQPMGPAQVSAAGFLTIPSMVDQTGENPIPTNRVTPAVSGGLPGASGNDIDCVTAPMIQAAPTTATADVHVGDKYVSVVSVTSVQPGEIISLADTSGTPIDNPATGNPVILGVAGKVDTADNRVYVSTIGQSPPGTYGYGWEQGLLSDPRQSSITPGQTIAMAGSNIYFQNYSQSSMTNYGGACAHIGITTYHGAGAAVGLGVDATTAGTDTSALAWGANINVRAMPGAANSLQGIELDVINNASNNLQNNALWIGTSNGAYENGAAISVTGTSQPASITGTAETVKSWKNGVVVLTADQSSFQDSSDANVSYDDTGWHAGSLNLRGNTAYGSILLRTGGSYSLPGTKTAFPSSAYIASGATTLTLTSTGSTPTVGSQVYNPGTGGPGNGVTFAANTVVTAASYNNGIATVTVAPATTGFIGSGSAIGFVGAVTPSFVDSQLVWGHQGSGSGTVYDPGSGARGAADWQVGPEADGSGATFDVVRNNVASLTCTGGTCADGFAVVHNTQQGFRGGLYTGGSSAHQTVVRELNANTSGTFDLTTSGAQPPTSATELPGLATSGAAGAISVTGDVVCFSGSSLMSWHVVANWLANTSGSLSLVKLVATETDGQTSPSAAWSLAGATDTTNNQPRIIVTTGSSTSVDCGSHVQETLVE